MSDRLGEIVALARRQVMLEEAIAETENSLSELKAMLTQVNMDLLPGAMDEQQLTEIKLDNGWKVELKDEVIVGIPQELKEQAFYWLEQHDYGAIIKTVVSTEFGKGEITKAHDLVKHLTIKRKVNAILERSVHHQTLKAFIREQYANIELAKRLPKELFGANLLQKTKVTAPKPQLKGS